MSWHPETNPHFIKTPLQQREAQDSQTSPIRGVSRRQDQQNQPPHGPLVTRPRSKGQGSKTKGASGARRGEYDYEPPPPRIRPAQPHPDRHPESHFPLHPLHDNEVRSPRVVLPPPRQDQRSQPRFPQRDGDFLSPWAVLPPGYQPQPRGSNHEEEPREPPMHQDLDNGSRGTHPQHEERKPRRSPSPGVPQAQDHENRGHSRGFGMPRPGRTKPITWLFAVFCAIFWIVIFLGGLIVLIVYLVYRPRSPRFDVSSATLNAAYIDAGSLLNADLTVLANFTNPNKKVSVDFSYMIIDLYYGSTLIATRYVEPFSAGKAESRFENVEMVASQVRLPIIEGERLQEQIGKNGVIFDVKGVFRVRSKLGSLLRYSYRLYGHCTILVTAPPSGVLRATKCRTKR